MSNGRVEITEAMVKRAAASLDRSYERTQSTVNVRGRVAGRCPSCGGESLFLGNGGHVTCSRLDCSAPTAADDLLHRDPPCKLCGDWGAANEQGQPRACIACGKEADVAVVAPLEVLRPSRDQKYGIGGVVPLTRRQEIR